MAGVGGGEMGDTGIASGDAGWEGVGCGAIVGVWVTHAANGSATKTHNKNSNVYFFIIVSLTDGFTLLYYIND
jgi:hypothetical protein